MLFKKIKIIRITNPIKYIMKLLKIFIIIFALPLLAYTTIHKYYISVTKIEYVENKKAIQITSRIFIDDFESLLKTKHHDTITLGETNEPKIIDVYIKNYLKEKITIKINEEVVDVVFLGKEYDGDIMCCYLEIEGVKKIKSFKISNKILLDVFEDQQNIVKLKMNSKQKSFLLTSEKKDATLIFD